MLLSSGTGGELCEGYGAFAGDVMIGELMITAALRDNLQVARVWIWVDPAHQRRGRRHPARDLRRQPGGGAGPNHLPRPGTDRRRPREREQSLRRADGLRAGQHRDRASARPARRPRAARPARRRGGPPSPGLPDPDRGRSGARRSGGVVRRAEEPDRRRDALRRPRGRGSGRRRRPSWPSRTATWWRRAAPGWRRTHSTGTAPWSATPWRPSATSTTATSTSGAPWSTARIAATGSGLAVKCALLRALSDGFPDKTFIETTNAETNAHMVAINEALGFQVAQVYGDFQKRL